MAAPVGRTLHPVLLAPGNINQQTRLATDFLNHFNEVIMLLEGAQRLKPVVARTGAVINGQQEARAILPMNQAAQDMDDASFENERS
jgi:hypothetical protein